jgi:hypothetical protein
MGVGGERKMGDEGWGIKRNRDRDRARDRARDRVSLN